MARHVIVRYRVRPGLVRRNEELVRAVYRELAALAPEGFLYETYRLEDGRTFVHHSFRSGDEPVPLTSLAAFADFQAEIADRCEWGPEVSEAEVVGRFG